MKIMAAFILVTWSLLYLLGSFVFADFDINNWHILARFGIAATAAIFACFAPVALASTT